MFSFIELTPTQLNPNRNQIVTTPLLPPHVCGIVKTETKLQHNEAFSTVLQLSLSSTDIDITVKAVIFYLHSNRKSGIYFQSTRP